MAQLAHQIAQVSEPVTDALWGVHLPGAGPAGGSMAGLAPVLGATQAQLALSLLSLLPWLCAHFRYSPHANVAALCLLVWAPFAGCCICGLRSPAWRMPAGNVPAAPAALAVHVLPLLSVHLCGCAVPAGALHSALPAALVSARFLLLIVSRHGRALTTFCSAASLRPACHGLVLSAGWPDRPRTRRRTRRPARPLGTTCWQRRWAC